MYAQGYNSIKLDKIFLNLLFTIFFVVGILKTVGVNTTGVNYIEFLFFSFSLFSVFFIKKVDKKNLIFILLLLFYFIISAFVSYLRYSNLLDFIVVYKFILYLIVIYTISNNRNFGLNNILIFYKKLLYLFFIVYFLQKFIGGIPRPQVVMENNFELVLLVFLFVFSQDFYSKINIKETVAIILVVLMSGSRSGAAILFLGLFFLMLNHMKSFRGIVFLIFMMISGFFTYIVFVNRLSNGGTIDQIDRVTMFNEFIYATKDWGWVEWLFGVPRITPLPQPSCNSLGFYENLFSYKDDGTCYSVILHAFDLRILYDHGIIVSLIVFSMIWMKLSENLSNKMALYIFLALLLTGMSVSSLNSVFCAIFLLLIFSLKKNF